MGDRKSLTWYTFSLMMVGLALLAVMIAVFAAMSIQWPAVIRGSLASNLTADYGAESLEAAVRQAPVRASLILDKLVEAGGKPTLPPGPLATAIASPTSTSRPIATPAASTTPTATRTAVPGKSGSKEIQMVQVEPTPTATLMPTATSTPSPTDTPQPTATNVPPSPPTNTPERPIPTPPPPTAVIKPSHGVSPLSTPSP